MGSKVAYINSHPRYAAKGAAAEVTTPPPNPDKNELVPLDSKFHPGAKRRRKSPLRSFKFPLSLRGVVYLGYASLVTGAYPAWHYTAKYIAERNFAAQPDAIKADSVRHGLAHVEEIGFDRGTQKNFKRDATLDEALRQNGKGDLKAGYVFVMN